MKSVIILMAAFCCLSLAQDKVNFEDEVLASTELLDNNLGFEYSKVQNYTNMTSNETSNLQKWQRGQQNNKENLEKLFKVAPFLNSTQGSLYQPFKGFWYTDEDPSTVSSSFTNHQGNATLYLQLSSLDYDEKKFTYQQTSTINNNTFSTSFDIMINLFNSVYLDQTLTMQFSFQLAYENQNKIRFDKSNNEIIIGNYKGYTYEFEMLSQTNKRRCSIKGVVQIDEQPDFFDGQMDQESMILESNDFSSQSNHKKVYKLSLKLMNTEPNSTCFPQKLYGEFYNVDYANLKQKLFNYCMAYMGITIILIYMMVYEYVKITQDRRENAQNISLVSLGLHSIWNLLSIAIHLIMGYQHFSTYATMMWAPVASLIILHFVVQRKLIIAIWKSQQSYLMTEADLRNNVMKCYSRYYFFAFIFLISFYKIFTIDILLISFFGTIWIPQIILNHVMGHHSRYHLSPGFLIFSSIHFLFFPSYSRGCPDNVFHTQPHQSTIVIILTAVTLQLLILLLQSIRDPIKYLPRSMRRRIRRIIRERNRRLGRGPQSTYQYYRAFIVDHESSVHTDRLSTVSQEHESITAIENQDCVICLSSLRNEPTDLNPDGTIADTSKVVTCKGYMLTPCNHKFHKMCLIKWMQMKLECPTCRARIPQIQRHDILGNDSDDDLSDNDINMIQP